MRRIRFGSLLLVCAAAAGSAFVSAGPARAAQELAPVMVVLDASGSMNEAVTGSGTKMAAAGAAVHTLAGAGLRSATAPAVGRTNLHQIHLM